MHKRVDLKEQHHNFTTYTTTLHINMSSNKSKGVIPPINCIFNYLEQQTTVTFWLYEQTGIRIRGKINGFDEFMNMVIEDAIEIPIDEKTNKELLDKSKRLGKILLKGDNITLITSVDD